MTEHLEDQIDRRAFAPIRARLTRDASLRGRAAVPFVLRNIR